MSNNYPTKILDVENLFYNTAVKQTITDILDTTFKPYHMVINDLSHRHAGHNSAAKTGGTHFELFIVSEKFNQKSRVQRHRMIYQALSGPLQNKVHALTINALSPDEYSNQMRS